MKSIRTLIILIFPLVLYAQFPGTGEPPGGMRGGPPPGGERPGMGALDPTTMIDSLLSQANRAYTNAMFSADIINRNMETFLSMTDSFASLPSIQKKWTDVKVELENTTIQSTNETRTTYLSYLDELDSCEKKLDSIWSEETGSKEIVDCLINHMDSLVTVKDSINEALKINDQAHRELEMLLEHARRMGGNPPSSGFRKSQSEELPKETLYSVRVAAANIENLLADIERQSEVGHWLLGKIDSLATSTEG